MITGFNTDVDYLGRIFHVQTEDRGLDNPIIESLVYCGGEIVESRRHSYSDLAAGGGVSEGEILARMEGQHKTLIREIRNGKFDPESMKPFGHNIISNRSLDEVVVDFLQENDEIGPLRMEVSDGFVLSKGSGTMVRIRVLEERTERPIAGADVKLTLISNRDRPRELFAGVTDAAGQLDAVVVIPDEPSAELAVLLRATAAGRRAVLQRQVRSGGSKP